MSLFGSTPPDSEPATAATPIRSRGGGGGGGLFDDDDDSRPKQHTKKASSNSLFADDDAGGNDSPWDMPTPRKQQSRADMIRNLLPAGDVPDSYIETFDTIVRLDGSNGRVRSSGVTKLFAGANIGTEAETRIKSIIKTGGDDVALGRGEFNVLLALVGLAQEGEVVSLDGVDERRRNLPKPKLSGLAAEPVLPDLDQLAAKAPQTPNKNLSTSSTPSFPPTMDNPDDDPWGSPSAHRHHAHAQSNGSTTSLNNGEAFGTSPPAALTTSPPVKVYAGPESEPSPGKPLGVPAAAGPGAWGYFDGSNNPAAGFSDEQQNAVASPFGAAAAGNHNAGAGNPLAGSRPVARTSSSVEENILVMLMPEKEGVFMFQHHNYEVASHRRGSKVIRRYSDFVWLLDCLQKRFPFRMLPLLPPKRMAVNGNHLSNDGSFIEKRRRGLARFLNALVRHPILGQEQLVVMFLTVPTHQELAVWRKQSTISVQDEFTDKALPPGLEESLPSTLEDLFSRTRTGVRRSADLYINVCSLMDRLVKRAEGVAADHARIAQSLISLTETSADTYATDTNEIPLLNDGLTAMSKHLRTAQGLLEDESRGWDEGVLEDLKRQRDALVSVREMFERRERLDKDNIPYLERRIQANETKLASLRAKPEGTVKAGEIEKVAESIIKDKESIVQQHNRSVFVKECIRDELITFQSTQYHISRWNQDWAGERVKYAEMLADNWRRLLDELEGMPLGD